MTTVVISLDSTLREVMEILEDHRRFPADLPGIDIPTEDGLSLLEIHYYPDLYKVGSQEIH